MPNDTAEQKHPHEVQRIVPQDRVVVVEQVYHQTEGRDPVMVESRFSKPIGSQEQPYKRIMKIGQEWRDVDMGWLRGEKIAVLHLLNESKDKRCIVHVRGRDTETDWLLLPGESMRGVPAVGFVPQLVCREGTATVAVTVYPG